MHRIKTDFSIEIKKVPQNKEKCCKFAIIFYILKKSSRPNIKKLINREKTSGKNTPTDIIVELLRHGYKCAAAKSKYTILYAVLREHHLYFVYAKR